MASAATVDDFEEQSIYIPASRTEVIKVLILGMVVGLLIPLFSFLVERFFIEPVFCRSADAFGVCATGGLTAYYIGAGLVSVVALVVLANWQVFRPLIIVVGAAAALWGLKKYSGDIAVNNGMEYYIFSAVLFAAAYVLFYWIMRVRQFVVSVLLAVALVMVVRLVLIS